LHKTSANGFMFPAALEFREPVIIDLALFDERGRDFTLKNFSA